MDPGPYDKEYVPPAAKAIADGGGKYVVRGGETAAFYGEPPKPRIAVMVFESMEKARAAFNSSAYQEAKKVKGRKRHIVTDTRGSLLAVQVHAANIQDVHGAVPLLKYIGLIFPKLRHIFADRVYRGKQLPAALAEFGKWVIEIVTRTESVGSFKPEPKRWVIERTLAWLNRCRRLSKDFEKTIASAEAWVLLASIRVLSRRLARA